MNDPMYRKLFSFPRMVEDLLRIVLPHEWLREIRFDTLEKLPAEYVAETGAQRRGDSAWTVRAGERDAPLLILLEFQTTRDPTMSQRMLEYTMLLYGELRRQSKLPPVPRWPIVLPIVVYNGEDAWPTPANVRDIIGAYPAPMAHLRPTNAWLLLDERRTTEDDIPHGNRMRTVVGIEKGSTEDDLAAVVAGMRDWLTPDGAQPDPGDAELAGAFRDAIREAYIQMQPEGANASQLARILGETSMDLLESMQHWPDKWRREGEQRGLARGVARGHRALRAQIELRLGADIAARAEPLLHVIADDKRLTEAATLVISAQTGKALIESLANLARRSH